MRVNALVVDLALLGEGAWDFLDRLSAALPGLGVVVATGRSSVAQRVRGLRAGADDWVTKPAHPEEVLARVEAVVRRRKQASARVETGPLVAGELEIRADQFQAFAARHQRGPDPARVRGPAAAGPDRGQGAPARGDLPGGVGLRDGPRRPLGGRVRPQGAPEAREGLARLELHPHALRRRLPLPAGARRAATTATSRWSRPRSARPTRATCRCTAGGRGPGAARRRPGRGASATARRRRARLAPQPQAASRTRAADAGPEQPRGLLAHDAPGRRAAARPRRSAPPTPLRATAAAPPRARPRPRRATSRLRHVRVPGRARLRAVAAGERHRVHLRHRARGQLVAAAPAIPRSRRTPCAPDGRSPPRSRASRSSAVAAWKSVREALERRLHQQPAVPGRALGDRLQLGLAQDPHEVVAELASAADARAGRAARASAARSSRTRSGQLERLGHEVRADVGGGHHRRGAVGHGGPRQLARSRPCPRARRPRRGAGGSGDPRSSSRLECRPGARRSS